MMKSGKGHQEDYEEYEEFCTKNSATPSTNIIKVDGKNSDKANAIRSKHSVTEQRRRSKINERFQMLRELIPHTDQKRDTATFLLEVIEYVQFLQEKVQKYEGSYQPWSSEPTKMTPWRNNHWRVQSVVGQPQNMKNGSGQQNPIESDHQIRDTPYRPIDPLQTSTPLSMANDGSFSHGPSQSAKCGSVQNEPTIEGGKISISSVYSQGLLNSLSQALQTTGLDLSQASISVQINLEKQANIGSNPEISIAKPSGNQQVVPFQDASNNEDLDQAKKRRKI